MVEEKDTPARAMLKKYSAGVRDINYNMRRLAAMDDAMTSPKASRLDGMPHGSGGFSDRIAAIIGQKDSIEQKITEQAESLAILRQQLDALIDAIDSPAERAVLNLRYIDGAGDWNTISAIMFGDNEDFTENPEKYIKRAFRIHGTALVKIDRAYEAQQQEGEKP